MVLFPLKVLNRIQTCDIQTLAHSFIRWPIECLYLMLSIQRKEKEMLLWANLTHTHALIVFNLKQVKSTKPINYADANDDSCHWTGLVLQNEHIGQCFHPNVFFVRMDTLYTMCIICLWFFKHHIYSPIFACWTACNFFTYNEKLNTMPTVAKDNRLDIKLQFIDTKSDNVGNKYYSQYKLTSCMLFRFSKKKKLSILCDVLKWA